MGKVKKYVTYHCLTTQTQTQILTLLGYQVHQFPRWHHFAVLTNRTLLSSNWYSEFIAANSCISHKWERLLRYSATRQWLKQNAALAPLKEVFWFMLKQIYTEGCRLPFKANFESRSLAGAHAHHVMISEMYYTEKMHRQSKCRRMHYVCLLRCVHRLLGPNLRRVEMAPSCLDAALPSMLLCVRPPGARFS